MDIFTLVIKNGLSSSHKNKDYSSNSFSIGGLEILKRKLRLLAQLNELIKGFLATGKRTKIKKLLIKLKSPSKNCH